MWKFFRFFQMFSGIWLDHNCWTRCLLETSWQVLKPAVDLMGAALQYFLVSGPAGVEISSDSGSRRKHLTDFLHTI